VQAGAGGAGLPGGYWLAAGDGGVFAFGDAPALGSASGLALNRPVVSIAPTPSGGGYWLATADGGVFTFGDAPFLGSEAGTALNAPVVAMTAPRSGARANLVDSTGAVTGRVNLSQQGGHTRVRVDARGLAPGFHGLHVHDVGTCTAPGFTSAGPHWNPDAGLHGGHGGDLPVLYARADGRAVADFTTDNFTVAQLVAADVAFVVHDRPDNYANIPATDVTTATGFSQRAYYYDSDPGAGVTLVAGAAPDTSGATGDAGARRLCGPLVAVAEGYRLAASDGGVFTFGGQTFFGSATDLGLNRPVVGMAAAPRGYWLAASDGGVFAFGDADFHGSTGGVALNQPVVGIAPSPSFAGYWL
ncbi:MAG: superoxide dismutase family protein, partial [Acidimicrobiales bacterium]